jgi:hypothetical protein
MRPGKSVTIARIDALAGFGPAVGPALLAGLLVIRVAVMLGTFTFAFVRIIVGVVAGVRLAGMILGHIDWNGEQSSQE